MSRLIPMLMLPVITRIYPSAEYIGLNDLNQTLISFAQSIAVCGMYDAMFRIFFDYDLIEKQKKICSSALLFVLSTSSVLMAVFFLWRKQIAAWYFGNEVYADLVVVTGGGFFLSALNQILSTPTRIRNKRKIFLTVNTLSPLISYSICIPLILKGWYIYAMPVGTVIAAVLTCTIFGIMNKKYFRFSAFKLECLKELLKIGIPLMPNFLVYWVYNSADKIMITMLLGSSFTGVYAVAGKVGHISNLIYTAFSGGWLYFSYSTMKDEDQVQLKSDIFEYLGAISFASAIFVMGFSRLGFKVIFPESYMEAYRIVPYLFLAPLLLMLYQIIANQFSIVKKTYMNLCTLSIGAVGNIILNFGLIPKIGMEGAAIATIMGYAISVTVCAVILKRMDLIKINSGVYGNLAILVLYYLIWRFLLRQNMLLSAGSAFLAVAYYTIRYWGKIKSMKKAL